MIAYFGGPLDSDFDAYYDTVSCNVPQHVGREILSRYIIKGTPTHTHTDSDLLVALVLPPLICFGLLYIIF
jgi:hypothetical protein